MRLVSDGIGRIMGLGEVTAAAVLIELVASLAQPSLAALDPGDDHL